MKKLLLASAAVLPLLASHTHAADLGPYGPATAYPQPYPAPAPIFCWTGFYIGGNIGGAWIQENVTDNLSGLTFNGGNSNAALIGGGQAGFNYQFGSFVLGAEWDIDGIASGNTTGNRVLIPNVGTVQLSANDSWISTLAARFGWAYDRWLIYGKAGAGWVGTSNVTGTNVATGVSVSGSNNNGNSGWLLGVGAEWAFAANWSAKIEYDFLGLSSRTFTTPGGTLAAASFTTNPNIQMVKVGINYRFDWGAPKY